MFKLNLGSLQPLVLTLDEAASRMGVTPTRVKAMIRNRQLMGFRSGRSWRVTSSSVQKWAAERSNGVRESVSTEPDSLS